MSIGFNLRDNPYLPAAKSPEFLFKSPGIPMKKEFDLSHFDTLSEAFIDASSIIYMLKAGFLRHLQENLDLYSVPEVLQEAGIPKTGFSLACCREEHASNDRKLLCCALERRIPLISEDKTLLMQAKRAGLPYYNALMMLNFLLYKHAINSGEFDDYYANLRCYARYSKSVWQYGDRVGQRIKNPLNA